MKKIIIYLLTLPAIAGIVTAYFYACKLFANLVERHPIAVILTIITILAIFVVIARLTKPNDQSK